MKKSLFILLVIAIAFTLPAMGQQLAGDILGPHNVNGHGCASCHAPHSGAKGNGGTDATTGEAYLWGRDFYATTYQTFGNDGTNNSPDQFTVSGAIDETNPLFHTAACLSCHDGNQTAVVGMTGNSVETVEGGKKVPTYLATDGVSLKNDHPVHVTYDPTSTYNWPGTVQANGAITWSTTDGATNAFQASYGRPFRLYAQAGTGSWVECSSCHNPHSVNYARSTFQGVKNTVKPTNFFVRGWYNMSTGSNSTQQFCRSCHFSKSNEYVNQTVPTT